MFVPIRNFGKYGVVHDTVGEALPIGAWTDARNVRFSGVELEKMLEPVLELEFTPGGALVEQGWGDSSSTYVAVATQTELYFLKKEDADSAEWVLAGSGYDPEGTWQAFAWGDTCVFNNGIDPPQVFNNGTLAFEPLPKWGLISTAGDLEEGASPSRDMRASCRVILPYKGFLVALGVTENGLYQPNTAWWSNATTLAGLATSIAGGGPPDWDYESPGSLSGKTEIGTGDGPITWAARLNENLIVYTDSSATALSFVGGTFVMSTRRLFNKGCAGLYLAAEFQNQHFVVAQEQLYVHDGSTVRLVGKDRVEDEFYARAGKRGRFGGTGINFQSMMLSKNPDRKEMWLGFDNIDRPNFLPAAGPPDLGNNVVATLLYAEETDALGVRFPDGKIWVEGTKIMANVGGDRLAYSSDMGQSWQELGNAPQPGGAEISRICFRPDTGQGEAWFIEQENTGQREAYRYFTTNLGASWTTLDDGGYDGFSSATLLVDSEHRVIFAGTSSGSSPVSGKHLARIDNPLVSNAIDTKIEMNYGGFQYNTDNIVDVVGEGYFLSVWDGSYRRARFFPYSMDDEIDYGWAVSRDDDAALSQVYVDPDGVNNVLIGRQSADIPLENWYLGMPAGGPVLVEPNWPDAISRTRANACDRYILAVADPSAGEANQWYVSLSEYVTTSDFLEPVTVTLPTDADSSKMMHLQHAVDDYWVGYYIEGGLMRIILLNFEAALPTRTALVWNYEDDNYTWADLSAANEDGSLDRCEHMHYRFECGWVTRWDSDNLAGVTWADLETATDPWNLALPPGWDEFSARGDAQGLYWLADAASYQSDAAVLASDAKLVFVERAQIDLDDLHAEWTTNQVKYLKQFVFHLQTPYTYEGSNEFEITAGWAQNLMDQPSWVAAARVELNTTANNGQYKWDVRTTGRYLSLRMDFPQTQEIRMTGADINVEPRYGR